MAYQPVKIDSSTGVIMTLDYPHHEIHSGSAFYYESVQSIDTTTYKWGLTTPNTTKWLHLVPSIFCTGEALFTLIEDPATFSGGAAGTPINANRNSATASGATIAAGVTSTGGTTLLSFRGGTTGGGPNSTSPVAVGGRAELILKQNEQYVFQIQTFAAVYGTLALAWYEHTNAA